MQTEENEEEPQALILSKEERERIPRIVELIDLGSNRIATKLRDEGFKNAGFLLNKLQAHGFLCWDMDRYRHTTPLKRMLLLDLCEPQSKPN